MIKKNITVKGMHCPSCETLLTDILEEEEVEVLSISHKTGALEISYDEKTINFEKIKKKLAEEGHEVLA
ncbi:heavy-metal-associated domain-containing protein [Candidatus Woesearchaeota archaeon]|nr:heavy-metal-associated domain-containing protein [Nanoarchaeota archaeon]MCB9370399.1 heavy-metal-associated domain-containing protein [Candidatus Woesearchaeota archaeon]USN44917.1 MAG: heavy-metal-associated domain-containing protein [Candidatus Woesearchaeota archaeon]